MASYDDDEEYSNDGGGGGGSRNGNTKNDDQSFIMDDDVPSDIENESDDYQSRNDDDDDNEEEMEEIENADDGQSDDNEEEIVNNDDRRKRKQQQQQQSSSKSDSQSKKVENSSSSSSTTTKNNDSKKKSSSSSSTTNRNNVRRKSPARDPKPRSKKVDLAKTRYLWVSGVPVGTKSTHLEEIFSKHGKVLAIKIIRGNNNSLLGFVKLESHDQAQRCLDKLNKTDFRGSKIELFKERPDDKDSDGKKLEKIGFRDSRKYIAKTTNTKTATYFIFSTNSLPSKLRRTPPIRLSSSGSHHHDRRNNERDGGSSRLDRERQKLKMERLRFEQEKAEYFKIEQKSRFEFERGGGGGSSAIVGDLRSEDKTGPPHRIRSMIKRNVGGGSFDDGSPFMHHEEKRYDDYNNRREFNSIRRYDSRESPMERKMNPRSSFGSITGGRNSYDTGSRPDHRYSDLGNKSWQPSLDSWMTTGLSSSIGADNRGWNSSTGYDHHTTPRILSSSIGGGTSGSMSSSRLNHSSDMNPRGHGGGGGGGGGYYNNNRRY
ncbi:uncharacterized protein LOC124496285 [Dermatophagoides farinae]|uniref:uncharacterized protein LOC124496285 n=1 Tax=Dermatophagoides farinae TaxID=6954 RepID=UPI003F60D272